MRIALLTLGTRGDVEPFLGLAKRLCGAGHDVVVSAPDNFESDAVAQGLSFEPIGVDIEAFLRSDRVRDVVSGNWLGLPRIWKSEVVPMFRQTLDACYRVGSTTDVLVFHPKVYAAMDVAEATGAVPVVAAPVPVFPTTDFPSIVFAGDYGATLNKLSWLMFHGSRLPYAQMLNRWREQVLGLGRGPFFAPVGAGRRGMALRLCAVSPRVIEKPGDWDSGTHMTGYWFRDEDTRWHPPAELATFLGAGPPPIYIGFGCMTHRSPGEIFRICMEAVRRAGVRAVYATGWSGIADESIPDDVCVIKGAPHRWLFPRVAAVVHHGGAGTVAAGLRAGRPTLVCPQAVDQPFWAKRVYDLGCGPAPLPMKSLARDVLAARLHKLTSEPTFRARSRALGESINEEDGLGRAIELIEAEVRRQRA